jgi:hypothetical protein
MSTEHRWDDNWQGKLNCLEINLCQWHFMHHITHTDYPGITPGVYVMKSQWWLTAWTKACRWINIVFTLCMLKLQWNYIIHNETWVFRNSFLLTQEKCDLVIQVLSELTHEMVTEHKLCVYLDMKAQKSINVHRWEKCICHNNLCTWYEIKHTYLELDIQNISISITWILRFVQH